MRDTATFVAFLTSSYFASAWCCLEICQAVEANLNVLFVVVDGASWPIGGAFPAAADVPESMVVHDEEDVTIRPREAFAKLAESAARVPHSKAFFGAFVGSLEASLGPPPAVANLEGEAKEMWKQCGFCRRLARMALAGGCRSAGNGFKMAELFSRHSW